MSFFRYREISFLRKFSRKPLTAFLLYDIFTKIFQKQLSFLKIPHAFDRFLHNFAQTVAKTVSDETVFA
jgi:hypothetical protein